MRSFPRSSNRSSERRTKGVRRAVVLMPNGFTLFNLFCGIYAIVLAARKEIASAPAFIVLGGIADTLDGLVARATGTGSRFGEELDSLVDVVTFGFAPPFIMYLASPEPHMTLEWLLVFIFTSCAVMRLARFNVEQAGRSKTHFHGLPSPAAGLTLASYYWFRETPLYNQTVILFTDSKTLSDLPWAVLLRGLMAMLAALMISDVPYPTMPSIGFRSPKKLFGTALVVGGVYLLFFRKEFIFPAMLAYVLFGAIKWVVFGFLGKSATPDEIYGARESLYGSSREERRPSGSHAAVPGAQGLAPESRREDRRDERREDRREGGRDAKLDERREERRSDEGSGPRRKRRRRGRGAPRPPGSSPSSPPPPESPTGPAE